jgi:hypothetical protein
MRIRVKCHGDARVHAAEVPEKAGRNYALCGMYWDTLVDDWRGEVSYEEPITCMECSWKDKVKGGEEWQR